MTATTWSRRQSVLWRITGRGLLIAVPSGSETWQLGLQAAVVWEALDTPRSPEEIVQEILASDPTGDPADVRSRVDEVLSQMHDLGLLEAAEVMAEQL